jgi:hypothetical protein
MAATAASDVATYLRSVYRRVYGTTPAERNRLLRICLAHRLKELPRDAIADVLRAVAREFVSESPVPDAPASPAELGPWREAVQELARLVDGATVVQGTDELKLLHTAVQRLAARAQVLAETVHKPGLPLSALLERAARDLQAHDHALEHAARESFERVLNALNPETLKKNIPKKTLSTETTYKAALFDAVVEKFNQLEMYHNKGRLVRDYKAAYKKYVQEESSH